MRLNQVSSLTGLPTDQIRYLEKKGFVKPIWKQLKERRVREYPEDEVQKIQVLAKYLNQGFKYEVAYDKALNEIQRPRLPL
jgi:DNA-binding transcriptional MerR regulator